MLIFTAVFTMAGCNSSSSGLYRVRELHSYVYISSAEFARGNQLDVLIRNETAYEIFPVSREGRSGFHIEFLYEDEWAVLPNPQIRLGEWISAQPFSYMRVMTFFEGELPAEARYRIRQTVAKVSNPDALHDLVYGFYWP